MLENLWNVFLRPLVISASPHNDSLGLMNVNHSTPTKPLKLFAHVFDLLLGEVVTAQSYSLMLLPVHMQVLYCTSIDSSPSNRHIVLVLVPKFLQCIQLLWCQNLCIWVRLWKFWQLILLLDLFFM